jgi:splicing factor 3B subunit 1
LSYVREDDLHCRSYAFQEQTSDDSAALLNGFGTIVNALNMRVKPYLRIIAHLIKWRLNNKSAKIRQQAADLISRIAVVMKTCGEEKLMGHLGVVLYEYLGEGTRICLRTRFVI